MLFNSLEFLIFLPTVFLFYWFIFNKNLFSQNLFILFSSYLFYGWWDYRFLSLIILSTIVDFIIGKKIHSSKDIKSKKVYLILSLVVNLGILGFFKYFNFFIDSFIDLITLTGYSLENQWTLKIILPVGISFYTFQTMSYSLDIFRNEMKPVNNFVAFASFVSFFPQLVAGPIERAKALLPQMMKKRNFDYLEAMFGLRLIIWGMFKKVVVADSLAKYVDIFYANPNDYIGLPSIVAMLFFTFQIYCDFSGYSDIAIGTARLFGIKLNRNFKVPYISTSFSEFWKRWHISLSSWFRDYVYISLGGNRVGKLLNYRNLIITFIVSGLWHGANYTFIVWGVIHGFLLIIEKFFIDIKSEISMNKIFKIIITFFITNITWVFFRSNDISQAFSVLKNATNLSMNITENIISFRGFGIDFFELLMMFLFILIVVFIEFFEDKIKNSNIYKSDKIQFIWIQLLIFFILFFATRGELKNFIYFQF
tara:strand:- start:18255 stop:19691 length:1437 start_codon:yes stop_codon:yes gene_type:complete